MSNQRDELVSCLECGAMVAPAVDRVFPVGCEEIICMECALRRGGVYDENEDRWETEPRIADLLESVESHAHPH
jgi:hypothetical protein